MSSAFALLVLSRADHLLPQHLILQFDTLPKQCTEFRHIEHILEDVLFGNINF